MKKYMTIALTGLLAMSSVALADKAEDARNYYDQGVAYVKAGEKSKASAAFQQVLKLYPNNSKARVQLANLDQNIAKADLEKRKARFASVNIKTIDLQDASLRESLDALGHHIETETNKEFAPNFVLVEAHAQQLRGKTITLKLNNVPADKVLEYILNAAGARASFDQYAIVITPLSTVRN
ncbi:tetratricopeptide repeat protein [Persicirhabdus sediminis]|uniref:Tetratricopeptide repeat protein n=1 Tax=Persicirhabdus sediminis TaxID=454144 RepID=A0A8J7SPC9_9BACT|nr:tetratricopeptide repeat protein [Persicirhabdus sediminis]MBK1792258.1 tetratricopeptide repeat protein [Persicirhabdus sediminis]